MSIFNANQFGFPQSISTFNAIIDSLKYVYDYLDEGCMVTDVNFSGFSKAFDCIEYEILLNKMSVCGIRGSSLEWFRSYLLTGSSM